MIRIGHSTRSSVVSNEKRERGQRQASSSGDTRCRSVCLSPPTAPYTTLRRSGARPGTSPAPVTFHTPRSTSMEDGAARDLALVDAVLRGDSAAFGEIVGRFQRLVASVAWRYGVSRD